MSDQQLSCYSAENMMHSVDCPPNLFLYKEGSDVVGWGQTKIPGKRPYFIDCYAELEVERYTMSDLYSPQLIEHLKKRYAEFVDDAPSDVRKYCISLPAAHCLSHESYGYILARSLKSLVFCVAVHKAKADIHLFKDFVVELEKELKSTFQVDKLYDLSQLPKLDAVYEY